MSSNLLSTWLGRVDAELKESLLLPVFLLETGRFVLSSVASDNGKQEDFFKEIKASPLDISKIEKEYFNATSTQVTSSIFKYWNLSESLIQTIAFTNDLDNCPPKYLKEAQILNVIKIICNVCDPLSDKFAQEGLSKAEEFNLNTDALEKAIEKMQDRMLDE
jgi:HD-like signal output (HDOD) protein